jgi:hypothetical protein
VKKNIILFSDKNSGRVGLIKIQGKQFAFLIEFIANRSALLGVAFRITQGAAELKVLGFSGLSTCLIDVQTVESANATATECVI